MITLPVASIGPTSGDLEDGFFVGKVNPVNPVAVLMGHGLVTIEQVLRKAVTPLGSTWEDFTVRAKDSAAADFAPFGAAADMSIGDAFYFRVTPGKECDKLYVQIATPGVGTWTTKLQEWNNTSDDWIDVIDLVDNSNGLRAGIGVFEIAYKHVQKGSVRLDDVSPKYVWHRVYLSSFTSATTAPVLSRIWAKEIVLSHLDVTESHTSDPDDFSSLPAEMLPGVGESIYVFHPGKPMGEDITITRSASSNYTTKSYYYASDNTWKLLTGVVDDSDGYRAAPSATPYKKRWTVPTDWGQRTLVDSTGVSHTGYATRLSIDTVTTEGPVLSPQVQCKSRSFGSANTDGIQMLTATTIKGVSLSHIGLPSSTNTVAQLFNLNNGTPVSFTIPANATSANIDTADLALAAGEKLGGSYLSGGEIEDVVILLQV